MADTRRTLAALQALLADNATGDISPQDLRDFLVSAAPAYGALYVSSAAATTISVQGQGTKASGTTAEIKSSSDVTVATTNRLTYTAAPDIDVLFLVSASVTSAGSSHNMALSVGENGTRIDSTQITRKIGTGSDKGSMMTFGMTTLSQNDYLEIMLQDDDGTSNLTLENAVFGFIGIFT